MTQKSKESSAPGTISKRFENSSKTASEPLDQFEARKSEHIHHALQPESQSKSTDLDHVVLVHEALPDLNFEDIHLECDYWGKSSPFPLFCSSMTAGNPKGKALNLILAEACSVKGWAMGLGSQRRELFDSSASDEARQLRRSHPNLILFANLGLAQVIQTEIDDIRRILENMQANALIVHLNPLQECLQPEGTPQFKGGYKALETLVKKLGVPLIVKEVGCGFGLKTLQRLSDLGVSAVDLAGRGGTHWGRIEGMRSGQGSPQAKASEVFKDWGFSNFESLNALQGKSVSYQVWASGGVRSGLDAAKLLAMGASKVGIAKPLMQAALEGVEQTLSVLEQFEYEIKVASFCVGASKLVELQSAAWYKKTSL